MLGSSGLAGIPARLCARRPEVPLSDVGRGVLPRPEGGAPRRWGFAPGGPAVRSFSPAAGGARGAGPRGRCSRGRVGDSCARSIPTPARAPLPPPQRAAPSNPHRSRAAPPAALSANTALVCAGAAGPGVRGARVCVCECVCVCVCVCARARPWGPASRSPPPAARNCIHTPPPTLFSGVGSRGPARADAGGHPDSRPTPPAPQFPHLESDPQGARGRLALLAPRPPAFTSAARPSRAGGGSLGRPGRKYPEASWRRGQQGLRHERAPLRWPRPLFSRLCRDHPSSFRSW